jgi:ketosteroid isomerase-like protein
MDSDAELRALVDERVAAVHAKDLTPLLDRVHADIVSYNLLPPSRTAGGAPVEAAARKWFDGYPGAIGYDVHDLDVMSAGDLGVCRFFYRVTGTVRDGSEVDMWVRATLVCRRVDGRWLIVHGHESVPFDAVTGDAILTEGP